MTLEITIEDRLVLANLPVDRDTTILVLDELRRLAEGKAVGTAKGRKDKKKKQHIQARQDDPRFISSLRAHARAASKELDKIVDDLESALIAMIEKYRSGSSTFTTLKTRSSIALKSATEQAFKLGVKAAGIVTEKGGLYAPTRSERTWLTSYLREELRYWNRFLDDLRTATDSQIATRVHNYCSTVRSAYESGRVLSVGDRVVIFWELESDNPCPDCVFLSRHAPYTSETLPTVPKGGQTRCLSYCYCSLRIVKTTAKEVSSVKRKNQTSKWYLDKIKKSRKKVSKQ